MLLNDRLLHELVGAQAARTPESTALVYEDVQMTYQELHARSTCLAHVLQGYGVGPDGIVGTFLERSMELVIALLGVLQAGGAYLSLNPEDPSGRLQYIVEDSGIQVVLTQHHLAGRLPPGTLETIVVDRTLPPSRSATPATHGHADNLAYIMYTSGSTGHPKGVMIPHRGICNRLLWMQEAYHLDSRDRVLQKTPVSFDVSVWEFFWTLSTGATLVLARLGGHRDPKYLVDVIRSHNITVVHFVPSMLAIWLEEPDVERCTSLRHVVCSGEVLSAELRDRFHRRLNAKLHNLYGPTEASIDVSAWTCDRSDREDTVPIGRPIANTQIYVVDSHLQPVPTGETGEICIGGAGLARGYLGRPDLTAERFVPNPFDSMPGARLYRTGDLGRYRPDGTLEFLGRMDDQVKIRGVRVEPGEVAATLDRHAAVQQSIVVVHEGEGGPALVAYVVPHHGAHLTESELREYARSVLPAVMVPTWIIFVSGLPLTSNGKVDRKALAQPPLPERGDVSEEDLPRTVTEQALLEVWQDVLGIRFLGVHDNFFDLGGHSLAAIRILTRVQRQWASELSIADLLDHPTIAEFGRLLSEPPPSPDSHAIPRRFHPEGTAPLSPAQQRLWFLDQLDPGNPAYIIPFTIRLHGEINAELVERCTTEIVRRHDVLRTTFMLPEGGVPVQRVSPYAHVVLPVTNLRMQPADRRDEIVRRLLADASSRPFDLATGPPVRASLVRLTDEESILSITMHHIVSDAWSVRIFKEEFDALCHSFSRGEPSPLPDLPLQYSDYAIWHRERVQEGTFATDLAYWREQLKGNLSPLNLPTDMPRSRFLSHEGARHIWCLDGDVVQSLFALCRSRAITPFMALLAIWCSLLARYSGQEDIVVGVPVAGRIRVELETLIGFFVNTVVLRIDLSGDPTLLDLLTRVRDTALDAFRHGDVPFERLVEELGPTRDMSRLPLFSVIFNYQEASLAIDDPWGAQAGTVGVGGQTAKVDLKLDVVREDERLWCGLEYSTSLFLPDRIAIMAQQLTGLLHNMVGNPGRSISSYPSRWGRS